MPLRDHFRPPVSDFASWEELHGGLPMVIVQQLQNVLPEGFVARPHVRMGPSFEIDIAAFDKSAAGRLVGSDAEGAVATAVWAPGEPSVALESELQDFAEYEVKIYDARRNRRLVAAIEIVSPANKDRFESRNAFVVKCIALLREGVAVGIVDLVTDMRFNLYAELMANLGGEDPSLGDRPPPIYAASCRWIRRDGRPILETWSHVLEVGRPLPTLPVWLSESFFVPMELESCYERTCADLRIA